MTDWVDHTGKENTGVLEMSVAEQVIRKLKYITRASSLGD